MSSAEKSRGSIRRTTLAAAIVGAVGLLGAHDPVPVEKPYPVVITTEDKAFVTDTFNAGVAFWKGQGVNGIEDVRLKFISGGEWATCYGYPTVTSNTSSLHCNGTIYITARGYTEGKNSFRRKLSVHHELGHAVHGKRGQLPVIDNKREELGATCLAGVSMQATDTLATMMALVGGEMTRTDVYNIGDDAIHGTGNEQKNAFAQGFTQQDCSSYTQHPFVHL